MEPQSSITVEASSHSVPAWSVSISSIDFSPLLFRKYKDYHSHSIHINLVILCLCKYNIHIEYNTVRFYKIYVLINVRDIFTGDGDLIWLSSLHNNILGSTWKIGQNWRQSLQHESGSQHLKSVDGVGSPLFEYQNTQVSILCHIHLRGNQQSISWKEMWKCWK